MPKTMDKKDVKLSYDSLRKVDWGEVKGLAGTSVPQLCKVLVRDALKKLEKGVYTAPYVKVGLIGKNLWFRLKDESSHIEDVLLVKDWEGPVEMTIVLSREQENALEAWIKERKDLLKACQEGVQEAIPLLKYILTRGDMMEAYLKKVKTGEYGEATGSGILLFSDKCADIVRDMKSTLARMQIIHDDDVYPDYEKHRRVTGPDGDLAEGGRLALPPHARPLYEDYTKTFFLQDVGPFYKKLDSFIKKGVSCCEIAEKQLVLIQTWSSEGSTELENYILEANDLFEFMDGELKGMGSESGMSPFSNLANGLASDIRSLVGASGNSQLMDMYLDNATGKITKARATMKRIYRRKNTVDKEFQSLRSIPKKFLKNPKISSIYTACDNVKEQSDTFVKQHEIYLNAGEKQFKLLKKEYEKRI